ncbi:hypothetical protein ABK040_001334 [Willaertia magna]
MSHSKSIPEPENNYRESSNSGDSNNNNNNCTINGQQELEINNEPAFHSIACINCRSIHKKCSKHLPSCMECIKRGKTCAYRTPKKKGRTKGSKNAALYEVELTFGDPPLNTTSIGNSSNSTNNVTNTIDSSNKNNITIEKQQQPVINRKKKKKNKHLVEPYPPVEQDLIEQDLIHNPPVQQNEQLLSNYIKTRTVDAYFDIVVLGGNPIVNREEMQRIVFEDFNSLDTRIKALLFSVQAVTDQRIGQAKAAEICFKEAKHYIAKQFDSINDFFVRATYGLLGLYAAGDGYDITNNFYLNSLKYYFESNNVQQENISTAEITVQELYGKASVCSRFKDINDLGSLWDGFKDFLLLRDGVNIPSGIENALKVGLNMETLPLFLQLSQLMKRYYITTQLETNHFNIISTMRDIIFDSVNIAMFMVVGYEGKENNILVDSVIEATTREYFVYCPVMIVHFIAMIAQYLIKCFDNIKSRLEGGELTPQDGQYFVRVSKLLRAFKLMRERYNRVEKFYGEIYHRLEEIHTLGMLMLQ